MPNKRKNVSTINRKWKKARTESASGSQTDLRTYTPVERDSQKTFADLAGLEEIKQTLIDTVIDPFCAGSGTVDELKLDMPAGVLLTGPPGTGKSVLAEGIVHEINKRLRKKVNFYWETGNCLSMWKGETEKNLRTVFQVAHANAPAVIFFDEIDGIGKGRQYTSFSDSQTTITTLLQEMNHVQDSKILVIAATNCPQLVDAALIRKGRFDLTLKIPLPNSAARQMIAQLYLEKKGLQIKPKDLNTIVNKTDRKTGCDIQSLIKAAHLKLIKRVFPNGYLNTTRKELREKMKASKMLNYNQDIAPALKLM